MKHELKNLGWYVYPNAYIIADRTREEDGDYMEVARITFDDGEIKIRKNSVLPAETLIALTETQRKIYNHEDFEISACGQTVRTGGNLSHIIYSLNGEKVDRKVLKENYKKAMPDKFFEDLEVIARNLFKTGCYEFEEQIKGNKYTFTLNAF